MNILRKFSVRPMVNTNNLSSNKLYPVIAMDESYYYVKGDDGVMTCILVTNATIEGIEL